MNSEEIYHSWGEPILDEIEALKCLLDGGFEKSRIFVFAGEDFFLLKVVQDKLVERFERHFPELVESLCSHYGIENETIAVPNADRLNGSCILLRHEGNDFAICFSNHPYSSISDEIKKALSRRGISQENVIVASITDDEQHGSWVKNHAPRIFADDPSTHMDIPCLFTWLFGEEEMKSFLAYCSELRMKASVASGIQTRRVPSSFGLALFRADMKQSFVFEYQEVVEKTLGEKYQASDKLLAALRENFIDGGRYQCLFGSSDFAKSFCSSEWRRRDNSLFGGLEQTGTVAGYLKCIEQLCFTILQSLSKTGEHSITLAAPRNKKGGPFGKKVYLSNNRFVAYGERSDKPLFLYPLTEEFLNARKHEITLGTMRAFLIRPELSVDPFYDEVESASFRSILGDALADFSSQMRNDKFHKSNFFDEGEVQVIRVQTVAIAWLLLGGIRIRAEQWDSAFAVDDESEILSKLVKGIGVSVSSFDPDDIKQYDSMQFYIHSSRSLYDGRWPAAAFLLNSAENGVRPNTPTSSILVEWGNGLTPEEARLLFEKAVTQYVTESIKENNWVSRLHSITLSSSAGTKCIHSQ